MPRLTVLLIALVALLGGALFATYANQQTGGTNEARIRAIVAETLAGNPANLPESGLAPAVDAATIHPMIESYLMANPRILERVSVALANEVRQEQLEKSRAALKTVQSEIYDDPDHVILGNPEGDVTLVELFDYNCGYCRSSLPDLAALLAEDPNLRVILKEFPLLSKESVDAALVAIAFNRTGGDYWSFHEALFSSRGQVNEQTALSAAQSLGANPIELQLAAKSKENMDILQRSFDLARTLGLSGTPTFIIGSEIIPGAVGIDSLRQRIANMRSCGETVCDS